jgi:predicted AlkP superfamily pyrophosphatase or phosphodiesterase
MVNNLKFWIFAGIFLIYGAVGFCQETVITDLKPTVLLISIDGFRNTYFDKFPTPTLHKLVSEGAYAKELKPIFPSITFPNHYSIVTGLYAEHHGIVANEIFDPQIPERFTITNDKIADRAEWWKGEPFWATVQRQGHLSGTMFWVGSSALIGGTRPTYWRKYMPTPIEKRIEQVVDWLKRPVDERPTFITMYFEQVDKAGHAFGPNSGQVKDAVALVDTALGDLFKKLNALGIENDLNIIVVSDHGMAEVFPGHVISLDAYVDMSMLRVVSSTTFANIWAEPTQVAALFSKLKKAHPHLKVYLKKDIPARYHYRDSPRIGDILCVADEGWVISPVKPPAEVALKVRGVHGYDNETKSMQAFFAARGPRFKRNFKTGVIENVDIYELMAKILSVTPAPNDGKLERIGLVLSGS